MSYRDELQAAQARNAALESELAAARREIAELKGESTALVRADGDTGLAVRGAAPTRELVFERSYDGSLDELALGEIAELFSDQTPVGNPNARLNVTTGSVMWSGAWGAYMVKARVSSRRDVVTVRLHVNIAAMGVGAGFVGGLLGSGAGLAVGGAAAAAALTPAIGLAPLIPVAWWVKRRLHRRWYRLQREKAEAFFAELTGLVEKRIVPPEPEPEPEPD